MVHEPVCVHRAASLEEASIVRAWLEDQGIHTVVEDPANPGVLAFGVTDSEGIAVYVSDPLRAKEAEKLLADHQRQRRLDVIGEGEVLVRCEGCGATLHFQAGARGTVQECGECGAFLDIE